MKRIVAVLLLSLMIAGPLCAQSLDTRSKSDTLSTPITTDHLVLTARDSLLFKVLYSAANSASYSVPRFKLYKTENIYNLIKLDTATGALWQVQYGMNNSSDAMEVPIDEYSLLSYDEGPIPGRYELYPTNNMYTFILLDTRKGYTYQVQWSTNPKQRFRMRIY